MTVKDFYKGQTVCLRAIPNGNAYRKVPTGAPPEAYLCPATVKSVGRCYVTVHRYSDIKFDVNNNFHEKTSGVLEGYALYLTPQEALEAMRLEEGWQAVRGYIDRQYKVPEKCTFEDLQLLHYMIARWKL